MSNRSKILSLMLSATLLALTLYWFQPWRLFTSVVVSEATPSIESDTAPVATHRDEQGAVESDIPNAVELRRGNLISHEHQTKGVVKILELADGKRVLRLEGFETSDGPDLEVWLSEAPVVEGYDGWFLADDGDFVSLGKLKGTVGDQNYEIPDDLDLKRYTSMSVWCVRFAVSFGAAELVAYK